MREALGYAASIPRGIPGADPIGFVRVRLQICVCVYFQKQTAALAGTAGRSPPMISYVVQWTNILNYICIKMFVLRWKCNGFSKVRRRGSQFPPSPANQAAEALTASGAAVQERAQPAAHVFGLVWCRPACSPCGSSGERPPVYLPKHKPCFGDFVSPSPQLLRSLRLSALL